MGRYRLVVPAERPASPPSCSPNSSAPPRSRRGARRSGSATTTRFGRSRPPAYSSSRARPLGANHNAHMFALVAARRDLQQAMIKSLREDGVVAPSHYVPLHDSPAGLRFARTPTALPVTERIAACLFRLPLHAMMTDAQTDFTIERVLFPRAAPHRDRGRPSGDGARRRLSRCGGDRRAAPRTGSFDERSGDLTRPGRVGDFVRRNANRTGTQDGQRRDEGRQAAQDAHAADGGRGAGPPNSSASSTRRSTVARRCCFRPTPISSPAPGASATARTGRRRSTRWKRPTASLPAPRRRC